MKTIRRGATCLSLLLLFVLTAALAEDRAGATQGIVPSAIPNAADAYEHLSALGGKRQDRGLWEIYSIDPLVPEGWSWAPSSTLGGSGTQYLIMTASYEPPSASSPLLTKTTKYDASYDPPDLSAAIAYIVASYAHVSSAADLTVHRQDISLVP